MVVFLSLRWRCAPVCGSKELLWWTPLRHDSASLYSLRSLRDKRSSRALTLVSLEHKDWGRMAQA